MKILALTPQLPYPPMQGTTLRNFYLLRELGRRHELSLLTFVEAEVPLSSAPPGAQLCPVQRGEQRGHKMQAASRQVGEMLGADSPLHAFCRAIRTVPAPPRRDLAQRALTSLASPLPDMALRLPSASFAAALRVWLAAEDFDIIQVEGIEMATYGLQARKAGTRARLSPSPAAPRSQLEAVSRRARLVFDDHNAEYVLQRSAFLSDARRPSRWHAALYSFVQWQKLARYERHVLRAHDAVAAVSQTDARALQQIAPGLIVHVVPNGVDTAEFVPRAPVVDRAAAESHDTAEDQDRSADLVFTGKMDYRPNIDAVLWFAEAILPRVRAQIPAARFVIVGQQPHARLAPLAGRDDVLLTGWVEDVKPYIAGAAVYVAPLRMGGGTRLKVLQAMSLAKPIVSTTLGCDGLSVQSGREALLADTPDAFAAAVVRLLRDPSLGRQLGAQARELAIAQYDWHRIGPLMEACYAA